MDVVDWPTKAADVRVRVIVEDEETLELAFVGSTTPLSLLNAIRRILLNETPTLAVDPDTIVIHTNRSIQHNDALLQRLSLLPIRATSSQIRVFHPSDVTFDIDVDATSNTVLVTTKDIRVSRPMAAGRVVVGACATAATFFPPDPRTGDHVLLSILREGRGDRLSVSFKARRDVGATHARWSPVARCALWRNDEDDTDRLAFEPQDGRSGRELLAAALDVLRDKVRDARELHEARDNGEVRVADESHALLAFLQDALLMSHDVAFAGVHASTLLCRCGNLTKALEGAFERMQLAVEAVRDALSYCRCRCG
jgi:DNA-directed RNA polymerase subunit L